MPRVLVLNSADFQDVAAVYRLLASAVNPREADRLFEDSRRGLRVGGAMKFLGSGLDGDLERGRTRGVPQPTMTAFAEWVGGWSGGDLRPSPWDFPLIVAIDEAQRLSAGTNTPAAYFLQAIHDATTKLPLTLVLAGLGDTARRAQEMGLTRGLGSHDVGCLAREEVDELLHGFCICFGLRAEGSEPRLAELAAAAEGWPRHLHFALQALGQEALAVEGDLARICWSSVRKRAAESRIRYNRSQRSEEMLQSRKLLGAVMRNLREGMMVDEIIGLIEANVAGEPGFRLPEATTSAAFCRQLVHRGVLQRRSDDSFYCPIPSFRSFLIGEGERSPSLGPESVKSAGGASF